MTEPDQATGVWTRGSYAFDGRIVASGVPDDVLTAELVARVFAVRLRRWADPDSGRQHLGFEQLHTVGRSSQTGQIRATLRDPASEGGIASDTPAF